MLFGLQCILYQSFMAMLPFYKLCVDGDPAGITSIFLHITTKRYI